ncbi:hypothetical protein [Aureisphaera sp.]
MSFRISTWWKDLLIKLVFLFSLFKIGSYIVSIFQAYYTTRNPLIPAYLADYTAFPLYFLIAIWVLISIGSWRLLRNEKHLKEWFYIVLIGSLFYLFLGQALLYQLLQRINPFG